MFDYEVRYKINGQVKMKIITLEEFIDVDFLEDFIYDRLEELEKCNDIEILHIMNLKSDVNVENISNENSEYNVYGSMMDYNY